LDRFAHRGTGLKVTSHFKLIFILYSVMVLLYLSVIVPRYIQFMERFHPAGISYVLHRHGLLLRLLLTTHVSPTSQVRP
jgi:hypothetical protein